MAKKTVHGARATLSINGNVVGLFDSCSYNVGLDVSAVYLLGRFSPAELVTVGVEPVGLTMSAFRVVDHGVFKDIAFTRIQDLLDQNYIEITLYDRQSDKRIGTVQSAVPTGQSASVSARQLMTQTVTFQGLMFSDESGTQAEPAGSTDLP